MVRAGFCPLWVSLESWCGVFSAGLFPLWVSWGVGLQRPGLGFAHRGELVWGGEAWALPTLLMWLLLHGPSGVIHGKPVGKGSCAGQ